MELEFHQLEQRHADLRIRDPKREGRLVASLATQGQQVPVVVVASEVQPMRYVLIDGYLRVASLQKLGQDTVMATEWPLSELDALVHHHHLSHSSRSAFEQAWFLCRLQEQGLTLDEMAQRLCRTKSWASRRLSLVKALPESVQHKVREGMIPPHAATKYLVPLARANKRQCETLVEALGREGLSDREVESLYAGWRHADATGRSRICEQPRLYLRAMQADAASKKATKNPGTDLINDLGILGAVAWRARRQLGSGLDFETEYKHDELQAAWRAAESAWNDLARTFAKALADAGSQDTDSHPGTP